MIDIAEVKYQAKFFELIVGDETNEETVVEVDFFPIDNELHLLDTLSKVLPEGGSYLEATPKNDSNHMFLVNAVNEDKVPVRQFIVAFKPFMEYMGAKFALTPMEN